MGLRGPAPKRAETRIRRNADYRPITEGEAGLHTPAPMEPDEAWHPIAIETWHSFEESGQSRFFEASDWAKLYLVCETMSRELKPQFIGMAKDVKVVEVNGREEVHEVMVPKAGTIPIKGASLSALNTMMTSLLMTEADRRRLSIELKLPTGTATEEPKKSTAQQMRDEVAKKRAEKAEKKVSGS